MKVAILGVRGIPACYSGYDTLAEELAAGLVKQGLAEVTVYCRSNYYKNKLNHYHGVRLIYLPAPGLKAFESLFHSFISSIHVLFNKVDIIYFVDPANAPFCLLLRLFRKKVVVHTDGLGWKRRKWGPIERRYYKLVEWLSARIASVLITDNPAMEDYYRSEYGVKSSYISYGAESSHETDEAVYGQFNVSPYNYLLLVARLEPENNIDLVITEYIHSQVNIPLIIVGDSPYNPQYMAHLQALANQHVIFTGRINDQPKLNALYKGAYLYIHGHEVGGTNPSLLRAMQAGAAPLAVDVPFNQFVIADTGFIFNKSPNDLSMQLQNLVKDHQTVNEMGSKAKTRAEKYFTWESVIKAHAELFAWLLTTK